jgi:tetratricopeptide (TPR) repeat protein
MRLALSVLSACLLVNGIPAQACGGGGMSSAAPTPSVQTPRDKARDAFNAGVHDVKQADKAQGSAAQDLYGSALGKFKQAVAQDATLPEAWNYVGYTSRKLGNYDDALAAYGKALSLKPGYADAIEYRGEAYLGLSRVPDAQAAYLDLYAANRALAAKLLTAMKSWVAGQRAKPSGATNLDDFDKWIQERAQIAGQTAALTREGAAASWR